MRNKHTARITGGNIRNGHIYFPEHFFPQDALGGSNKESAAPRKLTVTFDPGRTVETDFDLGKRFLREPGAVKDFFERAGAVEGDSITIKGHSPHEYTIARS